MSAKTQIEKIKAIILTSYRDFGRCPLASYLPTALWPVMGQPVLERLLTHLADQGIKDIVVGFSDEDSLLIESIHVDKRLEVKFLEEPLPVGTAGCIRDAVKDETDKLLLIVPATMLCPPDIDVLINMHHESKSDLTVILNPNSSCQSEHAGQNSGIYICTTDLLKDIPEDGYCDIKESLIPRLINKGKTVHVATLPEHTCNFRDRQEYLHAVARFLKKNNFNEELRSYKKADFHHVWISLESKVDPTARIFGPVVIMDGARISEGTVIIGPAILGRNVIVGKNSAIINSALWDGVQVGSNCQIQRCVVDYNGALEDNSVARNKCIPFKKRTFSGSLSSRAIKCKNKLHLYLQKISNLILKQDYSDTGNIFILFGLGMILFAFIWSYWPGLQALWKTWLGSDEYSSGLLVPFLAVYILWSRRNTIVKCPIQVSVIGGLLLLFSQALRVFGLFFQFGSAEKLSIVLSIISLVLFLFGWQLFRKVATILLFLFLMLPWPYRIQNAIAIPLQRWATTSAVFCLETIGYEPIQEGNVIHIGETTVAIAEACNGLRMIAAFFVISGLIVLLVKRTWWEKLIILISSLPIALLCNTIRLAITAIFFTILEGEYWQKVFHDFGGYAMMPLAIGIIIAELWLLTALTVPPEQKEEVIIVRKN